MQIKVFKQNVFDNVSPLSPPNKLMVFDSCQLAGNVTPVILMSQCSCLMSLLSTVVNHAKESG